MARNASVYTPIVFDQFLRRRGNQVPFGFFLGLSLYAFLLPAAARPDNPLAFGAVFLPVFTMVALVMLVTLIYGTIDQMRPTSVLPYIRDAAPHARYQRRALVARTRSAPTLPAEPATEVRADAFGFVADIRMAELEPVLRELGGEVEIVLQGPVGTYVSAGDVLGPGRRCGAG
ncbi:DUF2254 family protein [Nonomuraea sp. NPDC023979]|uniref:DUF2254 family protein n=1 Tax=Nonomuraea sp. NPDC023979 TaxID=3154796 RepID=UPI0033FC9415